MASVKQCPSGADTVLPSYVGIKCQLFDKGERNGGNPTVESFDIALFMNLNNNRF